MNDFSLFDATAALILCAAVFGWLNHRLLGLPQTTGLTVMGALASIGVVVVDSLLSGSHALRHFIEDIDFRATLMEGMLSFLLFAGALHIDLQEMRRSKWTIAVITIFGVVASTAEHDKSTECRYGSTLGRETASVRSYVHAVAIVLDLVNPILARRPFLYQARQLRHDPFRRWVRSCHDATAAY